MFFSFSATKWRIWQFFFLTKNNVHTCVQFGEDISFRSRVIFLKGPASFERFYAPLQMSEISTFFR